MSTKELFLQKTVFPNSKKKERKKKSNNMKQTNKKTANQNEKGKVP